MSSPDDRLDFVLAQLQDSLISGECSLRDVLNHLSRDAAGRDETVQKLVLCELIKRELERHWDEADAPAPAGFLRIETYLEEFSEVDFGDESLLELVEYEYSLRHEHGDWPEIEEYTRRFPRIAETARRRLKNLQDDLVTETSIKSLFLNRQPPVAVEDDEFSEDDAPPAHAVVPCPTLAALPDTLRHIHPFSDLSQHVREAVALHASLLEFDAGDVLLRQGEVADCLFILLEGSAEVELHQADSVHSIARIDRQTVIGELGLVTQEVRSANVTAITAGCAAIIAREAFEHIAGRYPRLSIALSELIAERVGTLTIDVLCGKKIGRYGIRHRLGRGAMGIVYAATDGDRQIALKMLRHDLAFDRLATQRFHQEAEVVREIGHENIVRVHDEFSAYGTSFIAMELCDGPSLADLIEHVGPLPLPVVRQVFGQMAAGLRRAHAAGIAHRDLKPSNVLLTADGTAKLADFGLARLLSSDQLALTAFGQIVGTPRYMAPEQLAGERGDAKADFYSLGCILFEMLTGRPLFTATKFTQLLKDRAVWSMPHSEAILPNLEPSLYGLLCALLEEDPDARDLDFLPSSEWAERVDLASLGVDGSASPDWAAPALSTRFDAARTP